MTVIWGDGMGYIFEEAENAAKRIGNRNPYDLLDFIGARVKFSNHYEPDGLKGYSTILHRQKFAVINAHLNEHDRRIVAGHEAAHLILHTDDILKSPVKALRDFNLYSNNGKLEHQANTFLADFLVGDDEVMYSISCDHDYFESARELVLPPPLLAFKLHSMMQRGHRVQNPVGLQSSFLGRTNSW